MADRCKMRCRVPGCMELVSGHYCAKHLHANPASQKETDEWYKTGAWRRFAMWIRSMNPMCQRLTHGVQCMKPGALVHHLISPRTRPDLLLDPKNVCTLCRAHHPDFDTPGWKVGVDYVETLCGVNC
jgi:hypothetical protein